MKMKRLALLLATLAACNKSAAPADNTPSAERGRQVYLSACITCHNGDPAKDGALGPAIAGSSRALIEARVMRATYPDGYKPKRDSRMMLALPHLKDSLDDLASYLK